jgi:hypothetical protein
MDDREKRQRLNELRELIDKKKKEKDYYKAMQLAYKLILNGTYGAFANKHFVCSNADIANAITAHGRDIIQYMMESIEKYFYNNWNLDTESHNLLGIEYIGEENGKFASYTKNFRMLEWSHSSLENLLNHKNIILSELEETKFKHNNINILYTYKVWDFSNVQTLDPNPIWGKLEDRDKYDGKNQVIIYGDTDSISSLSTVYINNEQFTIEEWYNNNIKNGSAGVTLNGHESVKTSDKILNWSNENELYYANVKRIIRHKVSKEKWKLKTKTGKEIEITNDHSMIVFRNEQKIEIKPRDILKTDKILIIYNNMNNIEYFFDDIEYCERIGSFEDEYVYDIEVDDETHTFIANDILVHNSLYISFTPLMKSVGFDPLQDSLTVKKFILHLDLVFVKPLFNKFLNEYADKFYIKSLHDFELETISQSALFLKKKHYLSNIVFEDGVHYEPLSYFYPKGIEIIRSSTPPFVRRNIYRIINYLFGNPTQVNVYDVMKLVKQIRKEFELADIEDISMTTSCSNYDIKVLDDNKTMSCKLGAHFGVKAAAFHNYLLNKNSEYKTKYDMVKSGRIKYYYCKHSVNNVFGYLRSFHPTEIVEKEKVILDVDEQFDISFLSIVNKFITPLGLPEINKRLSVLSSIFKLN